MMKSGKVAFVEFDGTPYKFDEYTLNIDGELPDMSHFGAGGGVFLVDGVTFNEIDLSGPFDVGGMPLTRGEEYEVTVGIDTGIEFTAVCRVASISINDKYKDGPRIKVNVKSSDGANFVASVS